MSKQTLHGLAKRELPTGGLIVRVKDCALRPVAGRPPM